MDFELQITRKRPETPGMDSKLACGVPGDLAPVVRASGRRFGADAADTRRKPTDFACRPPVGTTGSRSRLSPGGVPDPGKSEKKYFFRK